MFKNIIQLLKEYYAVIKVIILLRNKNLTEDQRDIIIYGDLKTADERLGCIRQPDGTVTYKPLGVSHQNNNR